MKTSDLPTAMELGFKPIFQPMTPDQTNLFFQIYLSDEIEIPENEIPHPIKIIDRRIEVLELPIQITMSAKVLLVVLTDGNPGRMVASLIDCLVKYENRTVNKDMIIELYENGFYSDASFHEYVENYLKIKKSKWSEIY